MIHADGFRHGFALLFRRTCSFRPPTASGTASPFFYVRRAATIRMIHVDGFRHGFALLLCQARRDNPDDRRK
jgi:hypothetical protein